jgi:hypothetical protein
MKIAMKLKPRLYASLKKLLTEDGLRFDIYAPYQN